MIYEVEKLHFTYPGSGREVLGGVSLTLEEGEILTLLGCNGAGKSTLLRLMLNLLQPQSGSVKLCGSPISEMSARAVAGLVSYVQQTQPSSFAYTVENYVLMGRAPLLGLMQKPGKADHAAALEAMERMGILALKDKPCTELSGGEYQQAMIARAIVRKPRAILFDEPTAHLDSGNQLRVLRIIKQLAASGYAVVVTTHNPDHAILLGGSTAVFSRDGSLKKGKTEDIVTEETLKNVYDTNLLLRYIPELERVVCIYPNL